VNQQAFVARVERAAPASTRPSPNWKMRPLPGYVLRPDCGDWVERPSCAAPSYPRVPWTDRNRRWVTARSIYPAGCTTERVSSGSGEDIGGRAECAREGWR
jgi:hypothetical protein